MTVSDQAVADRCPRSRQRSCSRKLRSDGPASRAGMRSSASSRLIWRTRLTDLLRVVASLGQRHRIPARALPMYLDQLDRRSRSALALKWKGYLAGAAGPRRAVRRPDGPSAQRPAATSPGRASMRPKWRRSGRVTDAALLRLGQDAPVAQGENSTRSAALSRQPNWPSSAINFCLTSLGVRGSGSG